MALQKGNVVQLASGGPKMTVVDVHDTRHTYSMSRREQPEYTVTCTWFDADGTIHKHTFEGASLVGA